MHLSRAIASMRKETTMKAIQHRRTFLSFGLAGVLALSLFTGCATKNDDSSQARTKLGTIPEFHPELGLGALQGYLDPKTLPDSLALIPPPPLAGSAALAHDEEVAQSTFVCVTHRGSPWQLPTSI